MSEPFSIRMPPDVQSVRIGGHQVVLIDNFLEDPHALVTAACERAYGPCAGADERKGYPGVRAQAPSAYSEQLAALADPLIRLNFGVPDALQFCKSACTFSLTTVAPAALGPLQRTPHFDSSAPHYMAVLLYLCDERHGGTGFYRHKSTGLQQITAENKARYSAAYEAELARRPPPARYFDAADEHFEFLGMMPAKFNRLVVYSGGLLHTACVNPGLSLTSDPRRGRLTVNTFIDYGTPAA